jgi:hypothetical protein
MAEWAIHDDLLNFLEQYASSVVSDPAHKI